MALERTLAVSSTACPARLRILANEQTINPPQKIKRAREGERERDRSIEGDEKDLLSHTMRLVTDSVTFIFSLCPWSYSQTHTLFSSCLPIENRVGDQIEFPTSTSFYSLRERGVRVVEEKISRDFSRSRCVTLRK